MVLFHLFALLIGGGAAPEWEPLDGARVSSCLAVQDSAGVAVIAHEGVGVDGMEAVQVRRVFLLRQRFWGDGSAVVPVNLPASSPVREEFSELLLGQTTRDLAGYWSDLYFHGIQPPRVLDSQEAVLLFVTRTPGAIGYVSLSFLRSHAVPPEVRIVGVWSSGGIPDRASLTGPGSSLDPAAAFHCLPP